MTNPTHPEASPAQVMPWKAPFRTNDITPGFSRVLDAAGKEVSSGLTASDARYLADTLNAATSPRDPAAWMREAAEKIFALTFGTRNAANDIGGIEAKRVADIAALIAATSPQPAPGGAREAFEAWAKDAGYYMTPHAHSPSLYDDIETSCAWLGFQAGIAHQAASARPSPEGAGETQFKPEPNEPETCVYCLRRRSEHSPFGYCAPRQGPKSSDWVMVPREATEEMFQAYWDAMRNLPESLRTGGHARSVKSQHWKRKARLRYAAMIAAAPASPRPSPDDAERVREKLAAAMIECSLATGHGDTIDDLLGEMKAQVIELRSVTVMLREDMHAASEVGNAGIRLHARLRAEMVEWVKNPANDWHRKRIQAALYDTAALATPSAAPLLTEE